MIWLVIFGITYIFPIIYTYFNVFAPIISKYICQRKYVLCLWTAFLVGLVRDSVLSSPKYGLFGLAGLLSAQTTFICASTFSFNERKGIIQISIIYAFFESCFSSIFFYLPVSLMYISWKSIFVYTVFTSIWTTIYHGTCWLIYTFRRYRAT